MVLRQPTRKQVNVLWCLVQPCQDLPCWLRDLLWPRLHVGDGGQTNHAAGAVVAAKAVVATALNTTTFDFKKMI